MLGPPDLQRALAAVARAIAESLEIREVWDRVAAACRAVVPFDGMGVSRLEPGGRVRVIAASGVAAATSLLELEFARSDFSPGYWPTDDDFLVLVKDSRRELDPRFAVDRDMIERGFRSILRLPLGRGQGRLGSLVLTASEPDRFTELHGRSLALVAELVALALAHEELARQWRERRARRQALERLVPTLTGTLDIRSVFDAISRIAQEVVPHDYFSLGLLDPDRAHVRIHARFGTGEDPHETPPFPIPEDERHFADWEYYLARDHVLLDGGKRLRAYLSHADPSRPAMVDRSLDGPWARVYTDLGVRSTLRAPIRLNGVVIGGIDFSSRKPDLYGDEHVEFAIRVAEHAALALAHKELAEGSRRTAAAEDRATVLEERVQTLVAELETRIQHRTLGKSAAWREVLAQAGKVAPTDTTVLLTGESGTGKEVVARFIHRASARKDGPFVALNCAALPEQLLESELFGHEKGAFTGATAARPGKIEQAARGVLFLDEVGEMSAAVQAKFLRVLQERDYQRLGGTRTLRADVRVLAATNRDLKAAIARGLFREDLYYRLAVFDIALPALRDRPDDIPLLAAAFLDEIGGSVGRPSAGISREAEARLLSYPWPGNVRELRNALERAVILCEGGLVTSAHLPICVVSAAAPVAAAPVAAAPVATATTAAPVVTARADGVTLESAERAMILEALTRAGNNKSKAARFLGLTRAQLRSRIEKHGIVLEG